MVDLIKTILKWIIIAIIIFLLIFLISKVVNKDTKKKAATSEVKTIHQDNSYERSIQDKEPVVIDDTYNDNSTNQTAVVNTPDTATKEELSIWFGIIILGIGCYYVYSKRKLIKQA